MNLWGVAFSLPLKPPSFHGSSSVSVRVTDYVRDRKGEDDKGSGGARSSWHHQNPGEASQNPELCLCLPSQSWLILITRPWASIGMREKHGVAACIHIKAAIPQKGTPTSSWAVKITMLQWLMTFSKATNINSYILDLWYEYFGVSKNLPERSSRSTGISPKNEWMELHDIKRARHNKIKLSSGHSESPQDGRESWPATDRS